MEFTVRRHGCRLTLSAVACALVLGLATVAHTGATGDAPHDLRLMRSDDDPTTPMTATRFRVGTFNVLGAGHTENSTRFEDGVTRMRYTVQLLRDNGLSVVGVQEMRRVQYDELVRLTGDEYYAWPGTTYAEAALQNSLLWRRDQWQVLRKETIRIPYFSGNEIRMPYVLLRQRTTGQRVWFSNFHNPADAHGDAEQWRDEATRRQLNLVNQLRETYPRVPVFYLGDFNEREEIFRKALAYTELEAANGGGRRGDRSWQYPPRPMPVDWIFGTQDVAMTGYTRLRSPLVQKASDHPLVMSDVHVPPLSVQQAGIRHVLVISVAGLRSGVLSTLPSSQIPALSRLRAKGVSTLNARTLRERSNQLPNEVGMLTGRRVARTAGGHGVASEGDRGSTVHAAAGQYASSIFDLAHNFGHSTALFAQRRNHALVARSYDEQHGGVDPYGIDNGRGKIDSVTIDNDGRSLTARVVRQIREAPHSLTFVALADPDSAGHRRGFRSSAYENAVRRTDQYINRMLNNIGTSPRTAGRTLVIVVGAHGGSGTSHSDANSLANVRVPFLVWGPKMAAGANIYTLNPHYRPPGATIPGYAGAQPVRTGSVANLALMGLGLPSVPGSRFSTAQDLNVFAGQ